MNVADGKGFTPLALVCSRGHNTSIPALLDSPNCELERANDAKHTPLMLCCLAGNEEAMNMLLSKGADASARGPEGKTALILAVAAGHVSLVKMLLAATKSKGVAEAQSVIEQRDDLGQTALMHGAAAGHATTVRALLLSGADRHALSRLGSNLDRTALMTAFAEGHKAVMDEFYDARSTLARQRPPLLALEGSEAKGLKLNTDDANVGVGSIVIDCGTGEFKVLALLQFERVVVYELGIMKWDKIDPELKKVQDVVSQDVGHPLDKEQMGTAFKCVVGAIHAALEKAKTKVEGYDRVTWTECYLSVTGWFRQLAPKPKARATAFLNAVELSTSHKLAELGMPIRLRWEVTSGFAEAQYEWKAVEYAVRQSGLGQPSLILSGGKGSVQVTGLDASFSFSAPLGDGEAFVKQHAGARSAGVAACEQFYQETMPVDKTLTTLFSQALENADEATIRVVAISGFYYAALAAKLIVKDAPRYQYLNASTIAESLVAMRNAEETKPADVAAAVCFHLLLPATLRTVGCNPMHPGCNRFHSYASRCASTSCCTNSSTRGTCTRWRSSSLATGSSAAVRRRRPTAPHGPPAGGSTRSARCSRATSHRIRTRASRATQCSPSRSCSKSGGCTSRSCGWPAACAARAASCSSRAPSTPLLRSEPTTAPPPRRARATSSRPRGLVGPSCSTTAAAATAPCCPSC